MQKSIFRYWHVRLALVILAALTVWLIIESFLSGYREGLEIRRQQELDKQAAPK